MEDKQWKILFMLSVLALVLSSHSLYSIEVSNQDWEDLMININLLETQSLALDNQLKEANKQLETAREQLQNSLDHSQTLNKHLSNALAHLEIAYSYQEQSTIQLQELRKSQIKSTILSLSLGLVTGAALTYIGGRL